MKISLVIFHPFPFVSIEKLMGNMSCTHIDATKTVRRRTFTKFAHEPTNEIECGHPPEHS